MFYKYPLFVKQLVKKAKMIFLLLLLLTFIPSLSLADENAAFEHLYEVMDNYHKTFDVYTDLSEAGNHFVMLGRMSSIGAGDKVEINPSFTDSCYSGVTCIENKFSSSGNNWGGWYFMNGVLEGEETQPKLNWGDYPDAGFDLTGATKLIFFAKGKNGGERVEFFAFGVGRDANTGNPIKPYPDSSPKVTLGYITLTNIWTEYELELTGVDLSYVLGGFAWVTNTVENNNQNITFYLDEIRYDKSRLDEPRFLVSYETIPSDSAFDTVMKNVAFGYDNALVLLAFLSRGTPEDMQRAKLLADAFVYAISHDRWFEDGRLRNGYQGGDLILFPGWKPHGKEGTVRMPGWWDVGDNKWYEDEFAVSTHTGNVLWPMIALLNYYKKAGGSQYLDAAKTLGEWVEMETRDEKCDGGYTGGYQGWEETDNNPDGQEKLMYKATEHNIDAYPAFMMLYEITDDIKWEERALYAKNLIEAMWNNPDKHFWTGTLNDGCTINDSNIPVDIQAWALMALDSYNSALIWAENNCYTEADGFKGFDFNNDNDGVWFEGTAQMAVAYQINEEKSKSDFYIGELIKAQMSALNTNGKGIVAASHDGVTTGFDWEYFSRLHIGATAWYIFAEMEYNPYWGIRTTLIPVPDIKANGSDGPLSISQGDILIITVSLDPGSYDENPADWWVAATSPFGLYWFTLDKGWVRSDAPIRVYGGPLFSLSPYTILEISTLPLGGYTFYFGVDDNMDGVLDATYVDSVLVTIQ